ncbi:MAG: hypothetical protein ACYDHM_09240 [Acidiferrobacterales bacterium]
MAADDQHSGRHARCQSQQFRQHERCHCAIFRRRMHIGENREDQRQRQRGRWARHGHGSVYAGRLYCKTDGKQESFFSEARFP